MYVCICMYNDFGFFDVFTIKDFSSVIFLLRRPDFVFMDDYLAEGLLRLCVHLVKVSSPLIQVIVHLVQAFSDFI